LSTASPVLARVAGPAVALETAFLTAGLPPETRLEAARRMADAVRAEGAVPAFVGVIDGQATVGLEPAELERLVTTTLAIWPGR
jgi:pseudouridine-5'-phosphate glycosidase